MRVYVANKMTNNMAGNDPFIKMSLRTAFFCDGFLVTFT